MPGRKPRRSRSQSGGAVGGAAHVDPDPTEWRKAHRDEIRQRYPPVSVPIPVTPIREFVQTASRLLEVRHAEIDARAQDDHRRFVELFDEADFIMRRLGGLSLAAKQTGYHLTRFAAEEVERRCDALYDVCFSVSRFDYRERDGATPPEDWANEAYMQFNSLFKPFYDAHNLVVAIEVAVLPDLFEKWTFREPGE